jgi:hypothetical protein
MTSELYLRRAKLRIIATVAIEMTVEMDSDSIKSMTSFEDEAIKTLSRAGVSQWHMYVDDYTIENLDVRTVEETHER